LTRSLREGCERGVCDAIFVTEDHGIIPLLGNFIRGASLCEAGDVVLNLRIEALMKFEDDVCTLEVVGLLYNLSETIDGLVDGARPLEVGRGLEVGSQRLDFILGTEFGDEL
jgi:hypothetical protein